MGILLTKSTMPIVKYVAIILGYLMDGIYIILEKIGIPNIGLAIILFTVIIYLLMLPLQIQQQKFSKMNSIMAPELKKVQEKYKNKKDQESVERMNAETQAIYAKYGVSPTGSCVQLAVQMPILFALYQVIYKIPGYIGSIKNMFEGLTTSITGVSGYTDIIKNFVSNNSIRTLQLTYENDLITNNSVVDFLYKLNPSQWKTLATSDYFPQLSDAITETSEKVAKVNNFLGLNISDNPMSLIKSSFASHTWLILIAAALIPILAWVTQMLNYKMMPQASGGDDTASQTMKSMNTAMPLMSAFFCLTLPVGIGIYWIIGAVIRTLEMFFINKHLDKIDMDALVEKNKEAAAKKLAKAKSTSTAQVQSNANRKTKSISATAKNVSTKDVTAKGTAKPGSLAAKAGMVRDYDEKNRKK